MNCAARDVNKMIKATIDLSARERASCLNSIESFINEL